MNKLHGQRGAVAVEFALIVPIFLVLLLGIVEFGRVFNAQMQVTAAAREAVRVMAIQKQSDLSIATAIDSAPGLNPTLIASQVSIAPGSCTTDTEATVTVTYSVELLTDLFADSITVSGKGVMRCGG